MFFFSAQAQWSPGDLQGNTYRYGSVQIGTSDLPLKGRLEIKRVTPATATIDPFPFKHKILPNSLPHIHLSSQQGESQGSGWDISGNYSLNIERDGEDVIYMHPNGVNIAGENLTIGEDFYIGQNTASPDGSFAHFISFGLRPSNTTSSSGGFIHSGGLLQVSPAGDMYFYAAENGIAQGGFQDHNTFTIKNNGNIGVGTLNPTQLLTVSAQESDPVIRLENQKANDWEIYSNAGLRFRGGAEGSGTDLTDHLVIAENGNVLINVDPTASFPDVTGSTQDYKMFVNGGVACKEVKVRTDWADYVFDKDYEILPLTQVEAYIQANHHLPNMPAAKKVQEQGVELGDITTKQQEKIEELFLHLIELEKRITQLEKENQSLKSKNK